jgi:hypothetical protein
MSNVNVSESTSSCPITPISNISNIEIMSNVSIVSNVVLQLNDSSNLSSSTTIDFSDSTLSEYSDYQNSNITVAEIDPPSCVGVEGNSDIDIDDLPLPPLPEPYIVNIIKVDNVLDNEQSTQNTQNTQNTQLQQDNNSQVINLTTKPEYIIQHFDTCYERLVNLVQGTNYDLTNWTLLIIKTLKCVSYVKKLTPEQQVELGLEIIIFYLDNNTNITDDELVFIKVQADKLAWNVLESQGINKKNHKKNSKGVNKIQKRMDTNSNKMDIDVLASPLQIVNTIINKVEVIIKTKQLTPDTLMESLPMIIMNIVSVVDKYKHLTKTEKKNLIIQAIQTVIRERLPKLFNITSKQQKTLNLVIVSLPQIVDTSIGVVNGDIDFHIDFNKPSSFIKIINVILGCFRK